MFCYIRTVLPQLIAYLYVIIVDGITVSKRYLAPHEKFLSLVPVLMSTCSRNKIPFLGCTKGNKNSLNSTPLNWTTDIAAFEICKGKLTNTTLLHHLISNGLFFRLCSWWGSESKRQLLVTCRSQTFRICLFGKRIKKIFA